MKQNKFIISYIHGIYVLLVNRAKAFGYKIAKYKQTDKELYLLAVPWENNILDIGTNKPIEPDKLINKIFDAFYVLSEYKLLTTENKFHNRKYFKISLMFNITIHIDVYFVK